MRVAIVCMSHCPFYLLDWVSHHQKIGFDRIYLRLEGPEVSNYLNQCKQFPIVKVLEYQYYPIGNQMDRQCFLVMSSIEEAKKEGIDFLLHIDDDELFHLSDPWTLSSFLEAHQKDKDFLHFKNVEAVYPEREIATKKCFERTRWFKPCYKEDCRGYGNGKSMACLSTSPLIQPNGVHFFTGNQINVDPSEALILHFESCDYNQWKWKFSRSNPSHFEFYDESREVIKNCPNPETCESILQKFYLDKTGIQTTDHLWYWPL